MTLGKHNLLKTIFFLSLFPIGHHLEYSSSGSLTLGHMISSRCEPFPPPEYSVKEEPFIDYTFSPWTHRQGFDHSIVSPLQCNHHVQPTCVSPSCWPPFPTNHNPMKAISHDVNISTMVEVICQTFPPIKSLWAWLLTSLYFDCKRRSHRLDYILFSPLLT